MRGLLSRLRAKNEPPFGSEEHYLAAFSRFVEAASVEEKRASLDPIFLTEHFDIWLGAYLRALWAAQPPELAESLEPQRWILRRCAIYDVDTAFSELAEPSPEHLRERVARIVGEDDTVELRDEFIADVAALQADPEFDAIPSLTRSTMLEAAALAFFARWRAAAERADLDASIEYHEAALQAAPGDHPMVAKVLANDALSLTERFKLAGDLSDADRAATAADLAITVALPNELGLAAYFGIYGGVLSEIAESTGDGLYWLGAAHCYEQAAALAHPRSPKGSQYLDNLATMNAAVERDAVRAERPAGILGMNMVERERALAVDPELAERVTIIPKTAAELPDEDVATGLDERIEQLRRNLTRYETGSRAKLVAKATLAGQLRDRGLRDGDRAGADEALALADEVLTALPEGARDRVPMLHLRGVLLLESDAPQAGAALRAATAEAERLGDEAGVEIARVWGAWAAGRSSWSEAAEAYDIGLRILDLLVGRQSGRAYAEQRLLDDPGMANAAAMAHVRAGEVVEAALACERGRARLMSAALLREEADLGILRAAGREELADRLQALMVELDQLDRDQLEEEDDGLLSVRYASARQRFEALLAEVRSTKGLEDFLHVAGVDDLHAAAEAAGSPLVYLVAGDDGGAAIIVRDDSAAAVDLSGLTPAAVREHAERLLAASTPAELEPILDAAGRWLWDEVVAKFVAETRPAAVVVPTGLLGLLPLASAWTGESAAPTGRRYAVDDLTLRFAPNARIVVAASRRPVSAGGVLAVVDPRPAEAEQLHSAQHEADLAMRALDGEGTRLAREEATREAVLDAIRSAGAAHFACHAVAEPDEPLGSGLLLANDVRLTVRDLLPAKLALRFAVLSACETAVAGRDLPDEVVSLPASFLQAGTRCVVGSLWRVPDDSTLLLIALFYERLGEGVGTAAALRDAQRTLRDATGAELARYFRARIETSETMRAAHRIVALQEPAARPYAHPLHWAGFVHIGL